MDKQWPNGNIGENSTEARERPKNAEIAAVVDLYKKWRTEARQLARVRALTKEERIANVEAFIEEKKGTCRHLACLQNRAGITVRSTPHRRVISH